jgi:hypothetical protein
MPVVSEVEMQKKRLFLYSFGMLIVVISGLFASAHGQKLNKCRVTVKPEHAPKYRIGVSQRSIVDNKPWLLLQISIAPQYFNRRDMTALTALLNKEFCHEERLEVTICDTHKAAKDYSLIVDWLRGDTNAAMRGFYRLARPEGSESIIFSTERGRPLNEVEINFAGQQSS